MNAKLFVLPGVCLGGAALLLAPARPSEAFTKLTGSLAEDERDVRVFDNFLDTTADDNPAFQAQFPGWNGLDLAVWKAVVEWGSQLRDGTSLGSGGANFDGFWAGAATGIGDTNDNIASSIGSCGGGVLAFCESPLSDGWRIRFCEDVPWDDGPGSISGTTFDIQGVMTHEYGHALGLGHSGISQATMDPTIGNGETGERSIHADDSDGVQCIYGIASATKPKIVATVADTGANTLSIFGSDFGGIDNEVWFTPAAATATSVDPIVRVTGASSSGGGTLITVTIPAAAGPGDVMINKLGTGGATLSNAFPTDLVGTFGVPPEPHPDISSVTPSSIETLIPGTAQTITITGVDLDNTTSVMLDLAPVPSSRWTIVSPTEITLDMPQANIGGHDIGVTDGIFTDEFTVAVVAPATPKLQWGTGDAGNAVDNDLSLEMIVAGQPGAVHLVLSSNTGVPTIGRHFSGMSGFESQGPFLSDPGSYRIPAAGWLALQIPNLPDPALVGSSWFAKSFAIAYPPPFAESNDQSITLVP